MISIIIPVYNEEKNIVPLYTRIKKILKNKNYEIVFIDDGSTDKTVKEVEKLRKNDRKVRLISFTKNYGKSAALQAGFDYSKGNVIITMDGDLQDLPEEIPKFLEAIKHSDMVVGWRWKRKDKFTKRLASLIFNNLTRLAIGIKIHDSNCGFKAIKRSLVKNIKLYGELHRYFPALAYMKGYKVSEIKIKHSRRLYGKTKYGLARMWRGFFDLLTINFLAKFSRRPFHFFGGFGFTSFFLGFLIGIWLISLWIIYGNIGGHTPAAILSMLLIILGVQLISLGLLAEMIASSKRKERPYEIKRKL